MSAWRRVLASASLVACALVHLPTMAQDVRVKSVEAPAAGLVSVSVEGPQVAKSEAASYSLQLGSGEPIKATEVSAGPSAAATTSVVVCVDKSGSMGNSTIDGVKAALDQMLAQSKPGTSIGIIGFGSATKTVAPLGTDPSVVRSRLKELAGESKDSKTKLFEAISGGLDQLKAGAAGGTQRLLVISDGKDEGSDTGIERIVEKAHANGVTIDAVAAGRFAAASSSSLVSITDRTGGRFALIKPGEGTIADALAPMFRAYSETSGSAVVKFKYDAAADGAKSDRAMLVFAPAGGPPVQRELKGSFVTAGKPGVAPVPEVAQAPRQAEESTRNISELVTRYRVPIIAVVSTLFAAAIILWLFVVMRKRREHEVAGVAGVAVAPAGPPSQRATRPATVGGPPPVRMTKFARYAFQSPAPGRPTAKLRGISGPIGVAEVPIVTGEFRIGADAANELALAGDEFVSSRHASIRFDSGSLYLSDRQSRNGTFLNGTRLTDVPMPLSLGDELRIGKSTMILEAPAASYAGSRDEGAVA